MKPQRACASSAIYSPTILRIYDWWVLRISNRYAWKCRTDKVLLPFFRRHMGRNHLDVGVGTGYYLANAELPPKVRLTLMDVNPDCLEAAERRSDRSATSLVRHDVTTELPASLREPFDSISLFYLLHCLPGTMDEKAVVFANLKPHLGKDGVLYGATILGDAAAHNGFGRRLMRIYNRRGIFGNRLDTAEDLERVLGDHFARVQVRVHGRVAMFEARQPIGLATPPAGAISGQRPRAAWRSP
ncbi:class I SAM-dependent methyltransferase [Pseudoxanthomonas putridarboris]|uniref:Class I SAM-dependent methyltransferase n=1 Tax=Pseudoxanthomonas putridarboris TaxID=752605 RepID=A0ABU9J4E8_9GAMM